MPKCGDLLHKTVLPGVKQEPEAAKKKYRSLVETGQDVSLAKSQTPGMYFAGPEQDASHVRYAKVKTPQNNYTGPRYYIQSVYLAVPYMCFPLS